MTFLDIEVGPNYLIVGCLDSKSGKVRQFREDEVKKFRKYAAKHNSWCTFNGIAYDSPLIGSWLAGMDPYETSKALIDGDSKYWDFPEGIPRDGHIDLMNIAPGTASLKLYGARINAPTIADLPVDPHDTLSKKWIKKVAKYNVNDLQLTQLLYEKLKGEVGLRRSIGDEYGINVLGKSDPQIAEAIIAHELGIIPREVKKSVPKSIRYKAPASVQFRSDHLTNIVKRIEATEIKISKAGQPVMPEWLKETVIPIGNSVYNLGMGGLHSMEKCQAVTKPMGNVDVASMYPSLILNLGLYPKQLGPRFLEVYRKIYETRLKAKAAGDKVVSNTLKIVLNGSYGKYGSIYSYLYAPDLMLTVTFTGQLYLLMLIEALEDAGIRVVSANTDGVEFIRPKKVKKLMKIIDKWEAATGLVLEENFYKALYSRDVNSYVAVYSDHVKAKGFYAPPGLSKNPEYPIVTEAIRKFLQDGTELEETIRGCTNPAAFCVSRTVRGGALWTDRVLPNSPEYIDYKRNSARKNKALERRNQDYKKQYLRDDDYIGKVVRYYYAINGAPMYYKESRNLVPKTNDFNGVRPLMTLPDDRPDDLDIDAYIELGKKHLKELGVDDASSGRC